jgi:hypothetical protein
MYERLFEPRQVCHTERASHWATQYTGNNFCSEALSFTLQFKILKFKVGLSELRW